jgi:beta-glucosidase
LSRAFGDRVHSYATLNEPDCSASLGSEIGVHAPGRTGKSSGKLAAHHLLLGHGLAMQVLQANSPQSKNGIVLNFAPCYPATTSAADREAARLADEVFNQWYIKPVIDGEYPACFTALASNMSAAIREGDLEIISQDLDFLGVNYYTRAVYRADAKDGFVEVAPRPPLTDMGWEVFPQGLTHLLLALNSQYDLPAIYITESGAAMPDVIESGQVNDLDRIHYLEKHLGAVSDAMEKGVRINGFFCWSLMDNFEWAKGYEKRFGIVYVDYATQQRTIKASGRAYRDMLMQRKQKLPATG